MNLIRVLKNQNKNIKTVTGTDADLRKLSKEDIKIKLIQLGIEEEAIQKMGAKGIVEIENQLKIIIGDHAKALIKQIDDLK